MDPRLLYDREPANILDIVVVSVSIISIVFSDSAGAVSVLKERIFI